MRASKRASGFTLIELILALSLSTFVLVGIVGITATIMRNHFDQIRRGDANVHTLYALQQLHMDLEEATYIVPNYPPVGGGNVIKGCKNYSPILATQGAAEYDVMEGGPNDLDGTGGTGGTSSYFIYCVRNDADDTFPHMKPDNSGTPLAAPQAPVRQRSLIRYSGSPCSASLPTPETTCGSTAGGDVVVNKRFYGIDSYDGSRFFRTNERRIRLMYSIGFSTPTAHVQMPAFYRIDTYITPDRGLYLD